MDNNHFYSYDAMNELEKDFSFQAWDNRIYLCAYQVNISGLMPFLQFFMQKCGDDIKFPSFLNIDMDFMTKCETLLDVTFFCHKKEMSQKYIYKGIKKEGDSIYVFFDCSEYAIDIVHLHRNNDMWLIAMDEIINNKHVCNFAIDLETMDFFQRNEAFAYICDKDGDPYEIPTVVYAGCKGSDLDLTAIFGLSISDEKSLGPHFYFTNYQNAIRQGGWCGEKGGLLRFALFMGITKFPTELPDYDWINDYDSAYIGNMLTDSPYWVVKNHSQQITLTQHFIDKSTLGESWDERKSGYYIL